MRHCAVDSTYSVLAFFLLVAAQGCQGAKQPDLPQCDNCHNLQELTQPASLQAPREWTSERGQGLTRKFTLQPSAQYSFESVYPRRGSHPSLGMSACSDCHPMNIDGIRHGIRQYPSTSRSKAFSPRQDCASSCHEWLGRSVQSTGFLASSGVAPEFKGSLRPFDLLSAAEHAHARIFRDGYSNQGDPSFSISQLRPGCAGCHNLKNEWHGTISDCIECHRFGGQSDPLHLIHLATIQAQRASFDPAHLSSSACSYCHGFEAPQTTLKNAVCYNCHLSGHQPVNAQGQPHFWPLSK